MKIPSLSVMLVAVFGVVGAQAQTTWVNTLYQKMTSDTGQQIVLKTDNVPQTGSQLSALPLVDGGATFEIWTLESGVGKTPIKLADKFVDSYQLSATLVVTAGDSYTTPEGIVVPRTRVDKPYTVAVNVNGLLVGNATAEEGAKKVTYKHEGYTYPEGVYVPPANPTKNIISTSSITQNGATNVAYSSSSLTGSGREYFTVSSMAGFGVQSGTLASGFIEVWPLPAVVMTGIENGATYKVVPQLNVDFTNLYPGSSTWVQIYQGSQALGTVGTMVPDSTVLNTQNIVTNDSKIVNNLPITDAGQYTVEVLHETPFGVERLAYRTFTYDTTIRVNGQIFSSE